MPAPEEAFIIHDGETIQEVAPAFLTLFRCLSEAVIGKRVEEIIVGSDLRKLAVLRGKYIMGSKDDAKEFMQPYDFARCDGTSFWGEAHSIRQEDGRYRTWVVWRYELDEWKR